jgi:hypothetical protein
METSMKLARPYQFMVTDGKYTVVFVAITHYQGAVDSATNKHWSNFPYREAIAEGICQVHEATGSTLMIGDIVRVDAPGGTVLSATIRYRSFSLTDLEASVFNGIIPDLILNYGVDLGAVFEGDGS